ncbi:TIGR02285 family protein [Aliiglaciecola sp. CAU 1673]|uniref:TIGR02285 family protein n=1 Tax=Aliiglaciecola sp. CAU 1673 TaxID=3032595 RepID=UPI0023DB6DC8|nr:TIGR02285 family protein [Aliiglaciecola sp. CAU 1673]MDF2176682.1 TIGR02285 family protein [Aliiglaciecola sp. CAU 1673]
MHFWLLLTLLASSVLAQQPDREVDSKASIQWAIPDAPPFHIVSGELAGQGFCDHLTSAISDAMPTIEHHFTVMPHPRIAMLREQKAPLCFPCMIKREDTDSTLYSNATHFYPPHRLLTRPEIAKRLEAQFGNPVSLQSLLANHNYRLGLTMGRKYSQPLQSIIDDNPRASFTHQDISASLGASGVLELIEKGRLDYTIDYAVVGRHYQKTRGLEVSALPIAENQHDFVIGAIGCSNSEWGRHAIESINQAIPQLRQSQRFLQGIEQWLAEEGLPYWPTFHRLINQSSVSLSAPVDTAEKP